MSTYGKKYTLNCETCGTAFIAKQYEINKGRRFCSSNCVPKTHLSPNATCQRCRSIFAQTGHGQRFCSKECRFWEKVNIKSADECWEWKGARNENGYGLFMEYIGRGKSKHIGAHRVSYELANGVNPADLFVCHSCDNPSCVNPNHLWLGTNDENIQDSTRKGRRAAAAAKLSYEAAEQIRAEYALNPISQRLIAEKWGVAPQSINKIIRNEAWRRREE